MIKRILHFLEQWDVVWSAPLAFLAFIGFAIAGEQFFGLGFGGYDPAIYQAGIYAVGITILFNGAIWIGFWFNWRDIYRYYLKQAIKDFNSLESWQRLLILFVSYWLYFFVLIVVWAKLV